MEPLGLWVQESLAMYFRHVAVQAGGGQWRAYFGYPAPMDTRFFQMPLERFFSITWKDYPQSDPGFYRGTGKLLMDFIFHGDGGAYLAKLPFLFTASAQGTPGPQIMSAIFPDMNLEQLGRRISDFKGSQREQLGRDRLCPLPLPIEAQRVPDESAPQEAPIAPEEVEALIAALKKLPHGDSFPSWYPGDILSSASPAR